MIRSRRFPWFIVTLYFEGANSCDLIYYAALVLLFPFYSSFFFSTGGRTLIFSLSLSRSAVALAMTFCVNDSKAREVVSFGRWCCGKSYSKLNKFSKSKSSIFVKCSAWWVFAARTAASISDRKQLFICPLPKKWATMCSQSAWIRPRSLSQGGRLFRHPSLPSHQHSLPRFVRYRFWDQCVGHPEVAADEVLATVRSQNAYLWVTEETAVEDVV